VKFPRNAKLLRGTFDTAPFAAVLFLLVMFLLLSVLLPVPGVSLNLPEAENLPGTDKPTVAVAIDSVGRLFFSDQLVTEDELQRRLRRAVAGSRSALAIVIQADKSVTYGQLLRVVLLAHDAGIHEALLATLPRVVVAPRQP